MNNADTHIVVWGSFGIAQLPSDLATFYRDGVLIDRRNGTPMEMDSYSLYLALKALELRDRRSYENERAMLVHTVLRRMEACGGFWFHGPWTKSEKEVHLRFSAAAIRLFVDALKDGILADPQIIVRTLRKHLSFREEIEFGTWFLHDSLEQKGVWPHHPNRLVANNIWKSSDNNCLVLNTHVNTLVTSLYVLNNVLLSLEDTKFIAGLVRSGLASLNEVLKVRWTTEAEQFCRFDKLVRDCLFRTYSDDGSWIRTLWKKALRKGIHKLFFSARQFAQVHFPTFAFGDGYLGRDIGLPGDAFEYHYINAYDLVRLLIQLAEWNEPEDSTLTQRCGTLIDLAITYAIESDYWHYFKSSMWHTGRPKAWQTGRPMALCELILARLGTTSKLPPDSWVRAYCFVRRSLPPTPALLGHDPLIVADSGLDPVLDEGWDFGVLRNGRRFAINYFEDVFLLDDEVETAAFLRGRAASL